MISPYTTFDNSSKARICRLVETYGFRKSQPTVWFHRDIARSNQHCVYCSRLVGVGSAVESNREHLVGKKFVPSGTLGSQGAFNFIFRACKECNTEKSNLESHVSTVTMLTCSGRVERDDVDVVATRKASKDYHPSHPGQLVADVRNETKVDFGSAISVGLVGPPQLHPHYARMLAFRHVQGFYSLVTSSDPTNANTTRLLPEAQFGYFGSYAHRDWGNAQLVEVGRRVSDWPAPVQITTAEGYFRAIMRRKGGSGSPWFWALEWNKSHRLIGWLGDSFNRPLLFQDLPELDWRDIGMQGDARLRMREETPLRDEDDVLFEFDFGPSASPP